MEEKELVIRLEHPMGACDDAERQREVIISRKERNVSIDIPEGMELSQEEMKAVLSEIQNEIVDVVRGEVAKGDVNNLNRSKPKRKCQWWKG